MLGWTYSRTHLILMLHPEAVVVSSILLSLSFRPRGGRLILGQVCRGVVSLAGLRWLWAGLLRTACPFVVGKRFSFLGEVCR